eukprot:TRINITY_DN7923_c0_g5_i1.p1 TRINITY_DN7923_c0_g5~~TRINITY_DN7923_c0_g5_i1.p1  ORF type:complete len:282 (+),score=10.56 TRINITY_DN7923_c0_g5_i1:414-1259(+)
MPHLNHLSLQCDDRDLPLLIDFVRHFSVPHIARLLWWPSLESLKIPSGPVTGTTDITQPFQLLPTIKQQNPFFERSRVKEHIARHVQSDHVEEVRGMFDVRFGVGEIVPIVHRAFPNLKQWMVYDLIEPDFVFWLNWSECGLAQTVEKCQMMIDVWEDDEEGNEMESEESEAEQARYAASWDVPDATLCTIGASFTSLHTLSIFQNFHDNYILHSVSENSNRRVIDCVLTMITAMPALRKLCLELLVFQDVKIAGRLREIQAKGVRLHCGDVDEFIELGSA